MLVNSDLLLKSALKDGYAIPAYNINNLEWTRYILEACQSDRSPVILAATPSAISHFGGYEVVYNVVTSLIKSLNITIPVVLHLDHAATFEECKLAIDSGFTSVMIDASKESLEDNIFITNKVMKYAKSKEISVEAEVGNINVDNSFTSLEDAHLFVTRTNVDTLAPWVGNKHGFYDEEPLIDFELLGAICKEVRIPLVLHGASFLGDNKIKTAIFCGVCKININTDLQKAWSDSVRLFLSNNPGVCDPKMIIKSGEKSLKQRVHYINNLFGSKNRAN